MPIVLTYATDGSRSERLVVVFDNTCQEWRKRFKQWVLVRFREHVQEVFWRYASNTLVIVIRCSELAFALAALKEEIPRRALFR